MIYKLDSLDEDEREFDGKQGPENYTPRNKLASEAVAVSWG